jgi:glycosyltransferase involved in cell wall biosynthesis
VIKAYDFRGTAYRADLNALIDRLGLAGRCRIVDEVAYGELPGLFAASDLVVNFPVMDAFPVTFLECAACETPILTNPLPAYTQHPMAPHLIFTDSRSAEGLSKRMTEALDALPQWREAARAARVFVREHFDEALTGQTLVSAYVTARLHD